MILKAYKYRIYPTKSQRELIEKHFGSVRFIYNWGLEKKIKHYTEHKKTLSTIQIINEIVILKQQKEFEWLGEVNSQSLQNELRHLDVAFVNFFRAKKGFPKFKSKKDNHHSFSVPQHAKLENKLYIPKFKEGIKIKKHRDFKGQIKTVTISKNPSNQYFASILVESEEQLVSKNKINKETTIGIDLGIKDFLITSKGEKIDNPRFLRKSEKKLKIEQQKLSKKVLGSKNRDRQRKVVAKVHQKIANQRNDFQHKISKRLISENQTICLEDLNVKGMMQNRKLSKAIGDISWSSFVQKLVYKAEWYGTNIVTIGRFEPSTKLCSHCGALNGNLTLADRTWTCDCGIQHDRDINAAINIKNFGILKAVRLERPNHKACGDEGILLSMKQEECESLAHI